MHARRPNSVSSPPQSIAPPAMAMPIRRLRTRPARLTMWQLWSSAFPMQIPPAAACRRRPKANVMTIKAVAWRPGPKSLNDENRMHSFLPLSAAFVSDTLDRIFPVGNTR